MFENKFNTKKTDPLVEAVMQAQRDGDLRRQAEALVNEEFGVYNRNAVIRENLAAYDARLEEAYKCMKEGKPLDPVGKEDGDVDNDGDHDKSDKYLLNRRKTIGRAMGKRMDEKKMWEDGPVDAGSMEGSKSVTKSAPKEDPSLPKSYPGAASSAPTAARLSNAKAAVTPVKEEQIDEVSKKAAISAYREKEAQERDTGKLGGLIKRKFGAKTAHHAERAAAQSTVGLVRRGEDRGKEDSIARDRRHPTDRITKSGKVHKQDTATLKGNIKRRLGSHTKPDHLPEEAIDEAKYSYKAARAGKDIGKPGKMFSKIAQKAGERYGSEERGKKVAGAILKKIRAKHMEEETISEIVVQKSQMRPGETLGQTMNRLTGKTAVKGGANDPSSAKFKGPTSAPAAPAKQAGAPDEKSTQSFLKSQGVGVKPPEQRAAPSMSVMDPKAASIKPSAPAAPVSNQSAASGNLPSMASGLPGSTGAKPALAPATPKPAGGFDAGAAENKKRAAGALEESVQIGDYNYRIV